VTGCAALASVDAASAELLSAEFLSVDLWVDGLSVDLPSPAFELDDLAGWGPSVVSSEAVALSPGRPPSVGGSLERLAWVESAADVVSRGDLSEAASLFARCEGDGSGDGFGALDGSGWILLSTSAAKLSKACDESRPLGFAGALK
jgi:hypothetical protein